MKKVIILTAVVSLVALASVLFFWKSSPSAAPNIAFKKKVTAQAQRGAEEDFSSRPRHDSGDLNEKDRDEKRRFTDSFYENAMIGDEFGIESQVMYRELDDLDDFSDPWQHEQYKSLYNELAREELEREYEESLMFSYSLWEMEELERTYADSYVKTFRESDLKSRKEEREGKTFDERDFDKLPKERKDLLKDLAGLNSSSSKKDKSEPKRSASRLNEATKGQSLDELKIVRDKLSKPIVQKEKEGRRKFIDDRVNKVKSLSVEVKNETTLFYASKDSKKFYVFGVRKHVKLEESVPQPLEKKVFGATFLISTDKDFELNQVFDEENKRIDIVTVKDLTPAYILDRMDPSLNEKTLVAIDMESLLAERGLLEALMSEGYRLKRYDIEGKSVNYTPLRKQPNRKSDAKR